MKYYPMHMHLHTTHQPGASMDSHMYNAHKLGMNYIRFTDHDVRTGISQNSVMGFDFLRGQMEYKTDEGIKVGWNKSGSGEVETTADGFKLSANGDFVAIELYSGSKLHTASLLSDMSLTLDFSHTIDEESSVILDITLSQRPPDHKEGHFRYVIGKVTESQVPHTYTKELSPSANGIYRLNISEDIGKCDEVGGLDNVFASLSVIAAKSATVNLRSLKISRKYSYDEVIKRQRDLGIKVGEKYGITPFVTTEITGAGQHKNCFTSSVPVLKYDERDEISEEEAIAHVKRHGGIFSYNHPFEAEQYKRRQFTREDLDRIVCERSEELINSKVYGATVTEVGFPEGREPFAFADYLKLWDNLSLAGVFITGDGDSDCHKSHELWFDGNNFATYIAAPDDIPYPISEEVFNRSLINGNVYMGDPLYAPRDISFTVGSAQMGSVVMAKGEEYTATLSFKNTVSDATLRLIADGECVREENVGKCQVCTALTLLPRRAVSFVRAELYHNGRCIMLTNPIYFVTDEFCGDIPKERLAEI